MERETNGMEGETNEIEGETDGERLTIVGIAYVIETTSAIPNIFSFNRTVAPDGRFGNSRLKWICRFTYPLYLNSKFI